MFNSRININKNKIILAFLKLGLFKLNANFIKSETINVIKIIKNISKTLFKLIY